MPPPRRRSGPIIQVRAPAPRPAQRPAATAAREIPEQYRAVLIGRLEAAAARGLPMPDELYGAILAALFPEDFPADADLPQPAAPTDTAPGSKARRIVYGQRRRRKESLYHPRDLDAVAEDRVVLLGHLLRRGSGQRFEITGVGGLDVAGDDEMEVDREAA